MVVDVYGRRVTVLQPKKHHLNSHFLNRLTSVIKLTTIKLQVKKYAIEKRTTLTVFVVIVVK